MTGGREAARRPTRAPLRRRSRQRWAVAGGVAACWLVLDIVTGSVVSATAVLMVIAALAAAGVGGLRALGITRDHPWIRRMASRPWRDGQDVLKVAMWHLADVFLVTPSGALLAPNLVELQLNPDDLDFLCQRMEIGVISASMTEVYEEQVTAYEARLAGAGRAEVYVIAAGSVPPGRYRLRQGDPVSIDAQPDHYANAAPEWAYSAPQHAYAESGSHAWGKPDPDLTVGGGMVTIMEPSPTPVPVLRLVTGSSVAETRISGARAGRGSVELVLPDVLTVSREHATFTFSDGRWWITNQGRNGLTLNGAPVAGGNRSATAIRSAGGRAPTRCCYDLPGLPGAEAVQRTACHVLPVAPARYEALPVTLAEGSWLVSVGAWVLRLRLDTSAHTRADPAVPDGDKSPTTQAGTIVRRISEPGEDAVARVRGYFERNATARLAMAYYYQEFILGLAAPQTVPMMNVVIALDLSGEGAVSDYKKLLQGFIWKERGHARDLADFLLANGLLTPADLDDARQAAAENERNGVCEMARQRLQYRPKDTYTWIAGGGNSTSSCCGWVPRSHGSSRAGGWPRSCAACWPGKVIR